LGRIFRFCFFKEYSRLVCDDVELLSSNGKIQIIGISKKHSEETFSRNKDLFTKFLREFFANDSLTYEMKRVERKTPLPVMTNGNSTPKMNGETKNASPAVTIDDNVERSDFELALIRDLGAVPV